MTPRAGGYGIGNFINLRCCLLAGLDGLERLEEGNVRRCPAALLEISVPETVSPTCGDGRGDMAALAGYSDTSVKLWTALGRPDGGFAAPTLSWGAAANSMHISYMTPQAGDFNGDGRDDVAVWYAYPDKTTKLWTFTATVQGKFNKPFPSWTAPPGSYPRDRCKFVTGDFNGDGRDDLSVFYGQSSGDVKTYMHLATVNGGFSAPTDWWSSTPGQIDWKRIAPHAGDFNGDGRDDVIIWYDSDDGTDRISTLIAESKANNTFDPAYVSLTVPAGNWNVNKSQLVIGDYNGDGLDDIGAMHNQADGVTRMWTWASELRGGEYMFHGGLTPTWSYTPSDWIYTSTTLFKPYN